LGDKSPRDEIIERDAKLIDELKNRLLFSEEEKRLMEEELRRMYSLKDKEAELRQAEKKITDLYK
jgi:hypothetical protein